MMALADDIKKLEAFIVSGGQRFEYDGTTYTLTGARKLLKRLKEQQTTQKQQAESEKISTDARLRKAQKAVTDAETAVMVETRAFAKGNASEQDVRKAQIRLQAAKETLARLTPSKPVTARPSMTTKPVVTPKPADGSAERAEAARLEALAAAAGKGDGKGSVIGKGDAVTKKPEDTPKPEATAQNILDELAARFPAYQDWTVEQATAYFGADLIKVMTDTANGVYGVGKDKNKEAIMRAIEGTRYWQTTTTSIKRWDETSKPDRDKRIADQKILLAQTFGELGLDDATLTELATTIQRTGLTELGARQLVFGAAFAKPRTETGVQPRQLALQSSAADELRKIAKAYGFMPPDMDGQIEAILSGKPYGPTGIVLTKDAFRQKAETNARGTYGHLKDQFDAGLTLEDMFGNYRDIAARVLELDPNQIDFSSDPQKWSAAFGTKETGQLSLSDWVRKLKTDPQYKWSTTNQANQQVSSVVSTLERAFGLIR